MSVTSALKKRLRIKRKHPRFLRQDAHKLTKIAHNGSWRRPKGMHSKVRRHEKQKGKMPCIGYECNKLVRGLHPVGMPEVFVSNVNDLGNVNDGCVVRLASVGERKKIMILEECVKRGLRVLNPSNPEAYLENAKKATESKKKQLTEREKKKEESRKKRLEIAKQKKEAEEAAKQAAEAAEHADHDHEHVHEEIPEVKSPEAVEEKKESKKESVKEEPVKAAEPKSAPAEKVEKKEVKKMPKKEEEKAEVKEVEE